MKIFDFDVANNKYTNSIDIMKYVEIINIVSSKTPIKTMEELTKYDLINIPSDYSFESSSDIIFTDSAENLNFAVVKPKSTFKIINKENSSSFLYANVFQGKLLFDKDLNALQEACKETDTSQLSEEQQKVYNWFENGETGNSSKTIATTLYPEVTHWSCNEDNFTPSHPYDNSDFNRCIKFLEEVPEAVEKLSLIQNLSPEWKNLYSKWNVITNHIKNKEKDEAYKIIKECINLPKSKNSLF